MNIQKVKEFENIYLVNDAISVPKDSSNSDYKEILEWIDNGGSIEPEFTLDEKKDYQLEELDNYHFNSDELRQMTINDYFALSLNSDDRNLVAEQIQFLELQVELGAVTEENASFEYFYNGGSVKISLAQLRSLYIFMMNTVNTNFGVYKAHINAIENLSTIEEVEAYDFTDNYLKNQNLNIE